MQNTSLIRRFGAILYDAILLFALYVITTLVFVGLHHGEAVEPQTLSLQLTLLAVAIAYFVGYWSWKGRTLGMQSWGLQLETSDGGQPSLAQAALRFVAALLSWAPVGLGFLWQLWDKDSLTWHDRLSGTHIVHYPRKKKS